MVLALCICSPSLDKTIFAGTKNHLCLVIKAEASNDLSGMRSWQTHTVALIEGPTIITLGEMDQLKCLLPAVH